jgi:aspartyl protease family protein
MLRGYLLILIVIGVTASMLSRGTSLFSPSVASGSQQDIHVVEPQTSSDASARQQQTVATLEGSVQLQREPNGHFYADVEINGTQIHMLVDTGATGIALSREDARAAGIATSIGMNDVIGRGADGGVHGEFVTIDRVALGGTSVEHMPAMVLNSGEQSLLGQEFLKKFASVEIHGDTMTLR